MLFIGSAQPNRSQPNGFVPNGHALQGIAAETVTGLDEIAFQQDYHVSLADTVTATPSITNAYGIIAAETVALTAWTRAKVHDPLSDFEHP